MSSALNWKPLETFAAFSASFAAYAAIPFSAAYVGSEINVGLFYVISISSLVVIGLLMAGWASNNKFSFLGGLRATAQMISYEIPMGLALLAVLLVVGSSLAVFSGHRFARRAVERGMPIAIMNLGECRADPLAAVRLEADCTDVLPALLG